MDLGAVQFLTEIQANAHGGKFGSDVSDRVWGGEDAEHRHCVDDVRGFAAGLHGGQERLDAEQWACDIHCIDPPPSLCGILIDPVAAASHAGIVAEDIDRSY